MKHSSLLKEFEELMNGLEKEIGFSEWEPMGELKGIEYKSRRNDDLVLLENVFTRKGVEQKINDLGGLLQKEDCISYDIFGEPNYFILSLVQLQLSKNSNGVSEFKRLMERALGLGTETINLINGQQRGNIDSRSVPCLEGFLSVFPGLQLARQNLLRLYDILEVPKNERKIKIPQNELSDIQSDNSYNKRRAIGGNGTNSLKDLTREDSNLMGDSGKSYVDVALERLTFLIEDTTQEKDLCLGLYFVNQVFDREVEGVLLGINQNREGMLKSLGGAKEKVYDNITKNLIKIRDDWLKKQYSELKDIDKTSRKGFIEKVRVEYLQEIKKLEKLPGLLYNVLIKRRISEGDEDYNYLMAIPQMMEERCSIEEIIGAQDVNIPYPYISRGLKRPTIMFKIGGSTLDVILELAKNKKFSEARDILNGIANKLLELHKEYSIILTVGGGPLGNIEHNLHEVLQADQPTNRDVKLLSWNADYVEQYFENKAEYVSPEDIFKVDGDYLKRRIPIIPYIPPQLTYRIFGHSIPIDKSDVHTLGVASFFNIGDIFFLKDTDAIFNRDPNCDNSKEPLIPLKAVSIDVVLNGGGYVLVDNSYKGRYSSKVRLDGYSGWKNIKFSRDGIDNNDHGDHLIEKKAAEVFNSSHLLRGAYIKIVDGRNPESLIKMVTNKKEGSVIYIKDAQPKFIPELS